MIRSSPLKLGALTSYLYGEETYDPDKLGLGPLMIQRNGASNEDRWAGPLPIVVLRPQEQSAIVTSQTPVAMQWSDSPTSKIDWSFYGDSSAAAATRRVNAYQFNRLTGAANWLGFVTLTFPTATAHTVRAVRLSYRKHTAGTVAVAGTAVTGTGSAWQADRACVGNRIGFGSADPAAISTWYEISAIASDTGITLTSSAGTVAAGTPYVIEDLRLIVATTNATTTNGGLFVAKGLRIENFQAAGTTIPAATTVDNIRAVYWLKSAAVITETVGAGLGLQAEVDAQTQYCWLLHGTTTATLYKFNIRAALTLTAGADTTAYQLKSAVSAALTGTASQTNNGRVANPGHGPGAGSDCLYFTTTTRVYRTKALATITDGDTTHISGGDVMTEIPPGGAGTSAATALMNAIEYAGSIDRFWVSVAPTTATRSFRDYIAQYKTDASPLDRMIGCDTMQINQSAANGSITPSLTRVATAWQVWIEGGLAYVLSSSVAATGNFITLVPVGADWEFAAATGCRLILPRIALTDGYRLVAAWSQGDRVIGGDSGSNLGTSVEPHRLLYRTSGIADDSGAWTTVDASGDLSGVDASGGYVQFAVEFRTIGFACVPARINSVGVVWHDNATLDNYDGSANLSDAANKRFAWRFATAFGGTVPTLRVRLYDAQTGSLLVDDNSATPTGTWEKSTNGGGAWGAYDTADKANQTTFIRYTPASIADNVDVRATLTLT